MPSIMGTKKFREFLASAGDRDVIAEAANQAGCGVPVRGIRTAQGGCELLVRQATVEQLPGATLAADSSTGMLMSDEAGRFLERIELDSPVFVEIPNAPGQFVPVLGVRLSRKNEYHQGKLHVHVLVRPQSARAKDVTR